MDLHNLLLYNNYTISVVESCTGGLLSHEFTKYPNSSKYFIGGIIAYNKKIKNNILKVPENVPVVSKLCAEFLVKGLKNLMDTDFYVSVTGYAGPSAPNERLIGLICYSILYKGVFYTKKIHLKSNNRLDNNNKIIKLIKDDIIKLIYS